MSLRIWLPLTGNLNNNGIENITISSTDATVNSGGKIGSCYSFDGNSSYLFGTQNFLSNNTEDWTFCCWMKVNNSHNGCLFSCRNSANFNGITVFYYGSQWLIDDGKRWQFTPRITIESNKWYHVCVVRKKGIGKYLYIDGELDTSTTDVGTLTNVSTAYFSIGACQQSPTTIQGNWFNGHLNDVRFYDHALSIKEIKEISKALVVHYPLNGDELAPNQNLFRVSSFSPEDLATTNLVATSDTDWTNYIRYYNGAANLHNFENGMDIISLSASGNIGLAFARLASEIELDSSSYYTISCEAKCTKPSAHLDIGLSYYNTSNIWVWRGGTNPQNFNDVDKWQKFKLTFKPDANTQAISYCFTVVGASGSTDKLYIRRCKLEKSSYATSWVPNIDDVHYSVFDFDSNIENDISGYNNNGEIIGNLIRETNSPRNSYGIEFPLNTDYIRLLNMTTNGFANTYTFSWWAKYTKNYTGHMMWGFANGNRLNIYMANAGKNFYWNTGDSLNNPFGSVKPSEYVNGWHHFAVTGDGNVNKLYIDGEFKANATTYREITGSNIVFNGWDTGTGYKFNGSLSDFRIYATCLSEDDIKELFDVSAIIDDEKNCYCYEFIDSDELNINKNGLISSFNIIENNLIDKNFQIGKCINPNILDNNIDCEVTYNTSVKKTNYTSIPASFIEEHAGENITFSYDVNTEGERYSDEIGETSISYVRFGIHGYMTGINASGTSQTVYPFASYLQYSGGPKRVVMSWTIPTGWQQYGNLSLSVQLFDKPASTNKNLWFIKNVKMELSYYDTPYVKYGYDTNEKDYILSQEIKEI